MASFSGRDEKGRIRDRDKRREKGREG